MKSCVYRSCADEVGPAWPYLAYITGDAPFLTCQTVVSTFTLRDLDEQVHVSELEFGPALDITVK